MQTAFGNLLKFLRIKKGFTLRDFCVVNGLESSNYSRLERGLDPWAQKQDVLEKYATALGLVRGSDSWLEFFDLAAKMRGEIPKDLLSDEEVLKKLPVVFRILRGSQVTREKLDDLVEKIRRT